MIFGSVLCLGEVTVVYQFTVFRSDETLLMGLLDTMNADISTTSIPCYLQIRSHDDPD